MKLLPLVGNYTDVFGGRIISLFTDHLVSHKNQMKDLADFEQKIYFAIKDCDSTFTIKELASMLRETVISIIATAPKTSASEIVC
ncbi:MAG: hypothetical protein OEM02_11360 [Desulfobulbaceae bacterium]|nr:hypothetical protein [Desulfobulbaceae bacterium]